jgi:hypothetical protein
MLLENPGSSEASHNLLAQTRFGIPATDPRYEHTKSPPVYLPPAASYGGLPGAAQDRDIGGAATETEGQVT